MGIADRTEIQNFLEHLKVDRGRATQTIQAYQRDLEQFLNWADSVSMESVQGYLMHLGGAGLDPSSISRKLSALRQWLKFLGHEEWVKSIPNPRKSEKLRRFLSDQDLQAVLKAADKGLPYGRSTESLIARDRALIYLLYATGLRVSELAGIMGFHILWKEQLIRVTGKGNKERLVPFARVAMDHLWIYFQDYRPKLQPKSDHVFLNERGGGMTRQAIWNVLMELATQAGVAEVHPHLLRHTFATQLLEQGMGLRTLQLLLGHADLSTTQVYTHVTPAHLQEVIEKFHPRGGGGESGEA